MRSVLLRRVSLRARSAFSFSRRSPPRSGAARAVAAPPTVQPARVEPARVSRSLERWTCAPIPSPTSRRTAADRGNRLDPSRRPGHRLPSGQRPTYIRPSRDRVRVIDATTARSDPFFRKGLGQESRLVARRSKLAMLRCRAISLRTGGVGAGERQDDRREGSGGALCRRDQRCRWLPDGYAWSSHCGHSTGGAAAAQFARQTRDRLVQSSADPFSRGTHSPPLGDRSVASYDLRTGKVTELVPERRITPTPFRATDR